METPFKPTIDLQNLGPEIRSYIFQTLLDFEPFTTPDTLVAVVAKDTDKLIKQLQDEGVEFDEDKIRRSYRISISLKEGDTVLEEEGLDEDIFLAIRAAKDKLLGVLSQIQDDVISNSDRQVQIRQALNPENMH